MAESPLRIGGDQGYLRIATEEAFAPEELLAHYARLLDSPDVDPSFKSFMGFYLRSKAERPRFVFDRLADLGALRIADMDARGIDRQIIGLTAPGTQVLSPEDGHEISVLANDLLAEACKAHPARFTGMAACAPHAPEKAAKEIERAVSRLDMRAVIINSHTHGEYLDNPKFAPVLEAIEASGVPLYLHPQTPPASMAKPMVEAGLEGAIFGFGVETGLHALRMIIAGIFDRYPNLQVILGHAGETLPFMLYRLDFMHKAAVSSGRFEFMKPLKKGSVSTYLKEHFHITNSGVAWEPAIKFCQDVLGEDRVLYAMDYPYQCPPEEVRILDAMDMPPQTKKKFFQINAEGLFQL